MRHIHWGDVYMLEPRITGRLYRSERLYSRLIQGALDEEARLYQQFIDSYFTSSRKEPTVKIRKKLNPELVVEVIPHGESVAYSWKAIDTKAGTATFYSWADWEPVPQWETVETTLSDNGRLAEFRLSPITIHTICLPVGFKFVNTITGGLLIQRKVS